VEILISSGTILAKYSFDNVFRVTWYYWMLLINASTAITKCFFFETIQMGAIISKKLWTQLHSPRNPDILCLSYKTHTYLGLLEPVSSSKCICSDLISF